MNMLNSIILEGNITKVGNVVEFADSKQQLEVTISVERSYKNRSGKMVDETSEFDVVTYGGPMLDMLSRKGKEGQGIRVVGRLKQIKWVANGKDCSRVVIVAEHIEYKPKKSQKKEIDSEVKEAEDEKQHF
jgi:single-strand DNA-binding protein